MAWPLALGMVNNAVLQFTDRAFLAHESMASLEAALPASMLALIILGFFQSVVAYAGTFVTQYHGAGDAVRCRASYTAANWLAFGFGALVLAALPLGDWVFETFSTGADVIARQKAYYTITIAGGVSLFGQMAAQAYFTGLGKTRILFWVNVVGNLFNVALDPILIFGWFGAPHLGIAGAAYATVAATTLQWAILAWAVRRHHRVGGGSAGTPRPTSVDVGPSLAGGSSGTPRPTSVDVGPSAGGGSAGTPRPTKECQKPHLNSQLLTLNSEIFPLILRILRFGIPSGAYTVLNFVSFTIFVFVTGGVGHVEQAVSNAAFSVNYLLIAPMEGFAIAAQTLVGQARGRGDEVEAKRVGLRVWAVGLVIVTILSLLAVVFAHPILSIFAPGEAIQAARFHEVGFELFLLMAAWQLFDASDVILSGALKGAGDTTFVMALMIGVAFFIWLPLVWVVACWHNTMSALWSTMILYVMIMCAGSLARWLRGRWTRIRVI